MRNPEVLSSLVLIVLSAIFFYLTQFIPATKVSVIGSALFPRILLGITMVLALVNIWRTAKVACKPLADANNLSVFLVVGMLAATVLLMEVVGFVIISTLFLIALSLYMTRDFSTPSVVKTVVMSVVIVLVVNYIFVDFLMLTLPEGIVFGG